MTAILKTVRAITSKDFADDDDDILCAFAPPQKILIFSMFTSVLDLVAHGIKCTIPKCKFVQLDGDTKSADRGTVLHKFRTDPNVRVLLLTYRVGSEGLNLTEATNVICVEPWWTDAVHDQAKSRCWRMGQSKEVHVYNIYVRDTVEDRIVELCDAKSRMTENMLQGTAKKITVGLNKEGIQYILGIF
jgi:SNF2 family DNA or RNA helicase